MASSFDDVVRKLFKGGGLLFAGMVIELGVGFLAKVLIARWLGPVDFGAVALGKTTFAIAITVALLGLNSGVGRYLPRFDDDAHRRGVIVSALELSLPMSLLASVLVVGFAPWIAAAVFHDPAVTDVLRVFGGAIPFAVLLKVAIGGAQGAQTALPRVVAQNIGEPVVRFLAVIVAVLLGVGAVGIAVAYVVAIVAAAAIATYYLIRYTPVLKSVAPVRMHRDLLSFSAPLVVTSTMAFLLSNLDTFMLGYFSSTGEVGVYNVVYPMTALLTMFLSSFGFLFMPIISELDAEDAASEMKRVYQIVAKWIFMMTLPVFLVLALFPEMTIKVTFGTEYTTGALTLAILAVGFFSHAIAGPNGSTLTSIGRTRIIMYDNIVIAAANVVLNLLLIPRYGIVGAGVATSISYVSLNVLYSTQLYRDTGIHPFSWALVRPGAIALVVVGFIYAVTQTFFVVTIPLLVAMFVVFLGLYGFVILRFGGVEAEEVMIVLSFEERFGVDLGPVKTIANWVIGDE